MPTSELKPSPLFHSLSGLWERGGLTPSALTCLAMYLMLPATHQIKNAKPIQQSDLEELARPKADLTNNALALRALGRFDLEEFIENYTNEYEKEKGPTHPTVDRLLQTEIQQMSGELQPFIDQGYAPAPGANFQKLYQSTLKSVLREEATQQFNTLRTKTISKQASVYNTILKTHRLSLHTSSTQEGLKATSSEHTNKHQINFSGNCQDSLDLDTILNTLQQHPKPYHHLFWNYPGVAGSLGTADCFDTLVQAAYQESKAYIEAHPDLTELALYGHSLGGAVASQVARRLSAEEPKFKLTLVVDRSFSSITNVLNSNLPKNNTSIDLLVHYSAASILFGLSIGTLPAGVIASLSLVLACIIAAVGFCMAYLIQGINILLQMNALDMLAQGVRSFSNHSANFIHTCVNYISLILTLPLAIAGALAFGLVFGLIIGGASSCFQGNKDHPWVYPSKALITFVLYTLCCNVNTTPEIKHFMSTMTSDDQLCIINSCNDTVIKYDASLLVDLGVTVSGDRRKTMSVPKDLKGSFLFYSKHAHGEPFRSDVRGTIPTSNSYQA